MEEHGRVRVIQTHEDWSRLLAYCPPPKPDNMSHAELMLLSDAEQAEYQLERDIWHSDFGIGMTPVLSHCLREFQQIVRRNILGNHPVAAHVAISGAPTLGKTIIAQCLGQLFDREYRLLCKRRGIEFDRDEKILPFIYITGSPSMTIRGMNEQILTYLGALQSRARLTNYQIEMATIESIRRHHSSLLIIDDIHLVRGGNTQFSDIRDHIKLLTSKTSLMALIVGIDLHNTAFFKESIGQYSGQTGGRTTLFTVEHYSKVGKDWISLLGWIDSNLVLAKHRPGSLTGMHAYIWNRTKGRIGPLMSLVQLGALEAVRSGREQIDQQLLGSIRIDYNSHAEGAKVGT